MSGASVNGIYAPDLTTLNASGIRYSRPLTITKGGTYSGNWESQNPKVPAVSIQTSEPVVIENSNVRGRGDLIKGFRNRLTVKNVTGYGLNPNIPGWQVGRFVSAEEFINVKIENSYAENTGGVYFRDYRGDPKSGDTVTVLRNKFKNINGLPSNGKEGYSLGKPHSIAHMLQFNSVFDIPGVEIAWNEVINEPGKSQVEENINMFVSSGTKDSPIRIHDNYIQGAYSSLPNTETNYVGGGIILGDGSLYRTEDIGYTQVYNNQIVSTTNEGIAISGGVENHVYNNRVISSGLLPDGSRIASQNVGIYMWNAGVSATKRKLNFFNNSMTNNYVAWTKVSADGTTTENPWWFPDCGLQKSTCGGNIAAKNATLAMEKEEYQLWLKKLKDNSVSIGRTR